MNHVWFTIAVRDSDGCGWGDMSVRGMYIWRQFKKPRDYYINLKIKRKL